MSPSGEICGYDGVTVFSATTVGRRDKLGDEINAWLAAHSDRLPVSTVVNLTSDARFHCLSIVIFWRVVKGAPDARPSA